MLVKKSGQRHECPHHLVALGPCCGANMASILDWCVFACAQLHADLKHVAVQILADLHKTRSHRDVKPGNIMVVQRKGKVIVKLVDFAASRLQTEGKLDIIARHKSKA